jgi:hypothetical protein
MLDPDLVTRLRELLHNFRYGRHTLFPRDPFPGNSNHDRRCCRAFLTGLASTFSFLCGRGGAHNSHPDCTAFSIRNNLFTPWMICNVSYRLNL